MKNIICMVGVLMWLGLVSQCLGQSTLPPLTIAFDGSPLQPPNTAYTTYGYSESGMQFSSVSGNGFGRVGSPPPNSTRPENGSMYLNAAFGDSLSFVFTNGSLFDLNAVDLAEYSTVAVGLYGVFPVHFVGYFQDGSTIETDLTPDGIIDGTGPLQDFQTFNFTGWNNLTRVEIPTPLWSLDNLVVTPAPEPSTFALGVVGLGALLALARRRKRKVES